MHGFEHAQRLLGDYGENLVVLGEAFSEGTTGLVVPAYVTINSIEELNANKDKFKGEIIGIGGGAGIHANTVKAIDLYGLDYEQITSRTCNGSES
jgi:glycine betaine/proline transport system substrate-binding protein